MYVHALPTVHALPDLGIAAGRLRDDVSARSNRRESRDYFRRGIYLSNITSA